MKIHTLFLLGFGTNFGVHLNYQTEYSDQKDQLELLKVNFDKYYNKIQEDTDKAFNSFSTKDNEFADRLKFVEEKKTFFEERITYLENLIGREVGISLFETFKQRKNELNKSVNFWTWGILISVGLAIVWIFIVFYFNNFEEVKDINQRWQFFILNILKILPAIFLIYFTSNQYRKERNFQESYAFKSASALTIKAYVDILNSDENKDKLLMQAVENIYTSPIQQKSSSNESKSVKDTVKDLADSAKTIKESVSDFIKPK